MDSGWRWWDRRPAWFRWVFAVPAWLISCALVCLFMHLGFRSVAPGPGWGWFARFWGDVWEPAWLSGVLGFLWPILLCAFIPRGERLAAGFAFGLWVVLVLVGATGVVLSWRNGEWTWTTSGAAAQIVVGAATGYAGLLHALDAIDNHRPRAAVQSSSAGAVVLK